MTLTPSKMPQATYAHQRTSLFVEVIANLHCFVPNICEEQERNLFLNKFIDCTTMDPSHSLPGFSFASGTLKPAIVCNNLRSLLSHAESLIPNFLNEEDVHLLRVFFNQLQALMNPNDFEENQTQETKSEKSMSLDKFCKLNNNEHHQETQSNGGCPSPLLRKEPSNFNNISNDQKETSEIVAFQEGENPNLKNEQMNQHDDIMREDKDESGVLREIGRHVFNVETSGSDMGSTRGKNPIGQPVNGDIRKSNERVKETGLRDGREDEKVDTVPFEEKQPRKRKRTIMNDYQMRLIEKALVDEPDMQRNAASIQSWADKLSVHGSEVTASQLKNWLNNQKARLARADKDIRAPMEVDNAFPEKQSGPALRHSHDSPDSPGEDNAPSSAGFHSTRNDTDEKADATLAEFVILSAMEIFKRKLGQDVILVDGQGKEIDKGKLYQAQGKWYGWSLEESETCVVDITNLKTEKWMRLPYPSEATGMSFSEAETKIGVMRVLWDSNRVHVLQL